MLEYHTINQTNLSSLFRKQISQPYVINKAFKSLLFRGTCKGYDTTAFPTSKLYKVQREEPKTYGAILCYRDKYALVQGRYTGKWSFPKGHSNEGEQPLECTLREVAEETGIDSLPHPIEYKSLGYGKYYVFILKDQPKLVPRDTKEIMDTKWVTLEEMESMSLNADVSMFRRKLKEMSE
jgi:ADP-ribose pyrophosphatase YjhB (NUDIX family)